MSDFPNPSVQSYLMIEKNSASLLQEVVSSYMAQGYVPHGSPFAYNGKILQAMVHRNAAVR